MNRVEIKDYIKNEMQEVIKTSKQVRDFLVNRDVAYVERKKELELYKQVISANKNIVSASITMLNVERMNDDKSENK